jgi:pimeloyl-ACP methyl ester carboxylesterase
MAKNKKTAKILIVVLAVFIAWNILAFTSVSIAYNAVFSRCKTADYNTDYYYTYNEIDTTKYPREELFIPSGKNTLPAFLYNARSTQGLIVVSPGHRDYSDIKLPEITRFVDDGWMVLCFDYTGCYGSTGKNMIGYTQAPADLDAVLTYIEGNNRFNNLPIMLFGHSLGAYTSTAVLHYNHNIAAVVAASGFDDPMEQWNYSIRRFTGIFGHALAPYANLLMKIKFDDMAHFSAIDGINVSGIPILLLQGTTDEYYGNVSSIYTHKEKIKNPNCVIRVMDDENRHGHFDYFLSNRAVEYRKQVENKKVNPPLDKFLYMEHDDEIMNYINRFYLDFLP